MKKIILVLYVLIASVLTVTAQTQVPHHVMDAFKQSHPNAFQATWIPDGSNFKVSYFDEAKIQHFKVYDANDRVIFHQFEIMGTSIPTSIVDHYNQANIAAGSYKVWTIIDINGNTSYYGDYNNVRTNFNQSGEPIK